MSSNDSITVSKSSMKIFVVVLLAAFIGSYASNALTGGASLTGAAIVNDGNNKQAAAPTPTPTPPSMGEHNPPAPTPQGSISLAGTHMKGNPNADIFVVEYSDFECPFCGRFYSQTLDQVLEKYGDDIGFIYKNFPLSFHPNAQSSAEAAECAADQGKFWEMHDLIFENQRSLSRSNYEAWATQLGMDLTAFNDCMDSGKYASKVQADLSEGSANGISGTPGFLIVDKEGNVLQRVVGAQPFSAFDGILSQLV